MDTSMSSTDPLGGSPTGPRLSPSKYTIRTSPTKKAVGARAGQKKTIQDIFVTTPPSSASPSKNPSSPWLRLTVETGNYEEQAATRRPQVRSPRKAPSPKKKTSPQKRIEAQSTTTKVPLNDANGSSNQPKRGRGRPRKSDEPKLGRPGTPAQVRGGANGKIQGGGEHGRDHLGFEDDLSPPSYDAMTMGAEGVAHKHSCLDPDVDLVSECELDRSSSPVRDPESHFSQRASQDPFDLSVDLDVGPIRESHEHGGLTGYRKKHGTSVLEQELVNHSVNITGKLSKTPLSLHDSATTLAHQQSRSTRPLTLDPTGIHPEYDSIVESEDFSIISLNSLPSAHQRRNLPSIASANTMAGSQATRKRKAVNEDSEPFNDRSEVVNTSPSKKARRAHPLDPETTSSDSLRKPRHVSNFSPPPSSTQPARRGRGTHATDMAGSMLPKRSNPVRGARMPADILSPPTIQETQASGRGRKTRSPPKRKSPREGANNAQRLDQGQQENQEQLESHFSSRVGDSLKADGAPRLDSVKYPFLKPQSVESEGVEPQNTNVQDVELQIVESQVEPQNVVPQDTQAQQEHGHDYGAEEFSDEGIDIEIGDDSVLETVERSDDENADGLAEETDIWQLEAKSSNVAGALAVAHSSEDGGQPAEDASITSEEERTEGNVDLDLGRSLAKKSSNAQTKRKRGLSTGGLSRKSQKTRTSSSPASSTSSNEDDEAEVDRNEHDDDSESRYDDMAKDQGGSVNEEDTSDVIEDEILKKTLTATPNPHRRGKSSPPERPGRRGISKRGSAPAMKKAKGVFSADFLSPRRLFEPDKRLLQIGAFPYARARPRNPLTRFGMSVTKHFKAPEPTPEAWAYCEWQFNEPFTTHEPTNDTHWAHLEALRKRASMAPHKYLLDPTGAAAGLRDIVYRSGYGFDRKLDDWELAVVDKFLARLARDGTDLRGWFDKRPDIGAYKVGQMLFNLWIVDFMRGNQEPRGAEPTGLWEPGLKHTQEAVTEKYRRWKDGQEKA